MESKSSKKELIFFIVPVFILTYLLCGVAYIKGGLERFPAVVISMFIPAMIALIVQKFSRDKQAFRQSLGLRWGKPKYYLIGPATVFFIVSMSCLVSVVIFPQTLKSPAEIGRLLLQSVNKFGVPANGVWQAALLIFIFNVMIAPLVNILLFLGEEIGWRAYMTPRLLKLLGTKGVIVAGLIWSFWHSGFMLMGFNYPGYPLIGQFIFPLFCIPCGIILQYFYVRSGSVFCVAICHGVINWTSTVFGLFFLETDNSNPLLHGPAGIVACLVWLLAGAFFYLATTRLPLNADEKHPSNIISDLN